MEESSLKEGVWQFFSILLLMLLIACRFEKYGSMEKLSREKEERISPQARLKGKKEGLCLPQVLRTIIQNDQEETNELDRDHCFLSDFHEDLIYTILLINP